MRAFYDSHGPFSAGINANDAVLNYKSGILTAADCGEADVETDHEIIVVGYDAEAGDGDGAWIIQNSWGPNYGVTLEGNECGDGDGDSDGDSDGDGDGGDCGFIYLAYGSCGITDGP